MTIIHTVSRYGCRYRPNWDSLQEVIAWNIATRGRELPGIWWALILWPIVAPSTVKGFLAASTLSTSGRQYSLRESNSTIFTSVHICSVSSINSLLIMWPILLSLTIFKFARVILCLPLASTIQAYRLFDSAASHIYICSFLWFAEELLKLFLTLNRH